MERALEVLKNIKKRKTGNKVIDDLFREFYSPGNAPEVLNGWDFRPEKVNQAFQNNSMYHADIDTPNRTCKLSCEYCFVHGDSRYKGQNLLSPSEWKDSMTQLSEEGVESVKIVGQGETTDDPRFFEYLEHLNKLAITPVVFSAGYIFGNDDVSRRVHGISGDDVIDRTLDLGASVMIKYDSPRAEVQDRLVRKPGYTEKRNEAIKRFLRRNIRDGETSRFGLETNLGLHNFGDVSDIYSLRHLVGLYPDICLTMDCGALERIMGEDKVSGLTRKQIEEVYAGIHFLNENLGMRDNGVSPYIGVMKCSQVSLPSLYLTGGGDIYFACCGDTKDKIGNVREMSIKEAREKAKEISSNYSLGFLHGCPFREEVGVIHNDLERNSNERMRKLRRNQKVQKFVVNPLLNLGKIAAGIAIFAVLYQGLQDNKTELEYNSLERLSMVRQVQGIDYFESLKNKD
jgi:hypothetical protein